jgi:hypothetical protein
MASHVNLDALIPREDFDVVPENDDAPVPLTISVRHLEKRDFFYQALRKPDFQRETAEWGPDRVTGLIKTFVDGELIPAVILWRNQGLLFIIDGSHRLSALMAWVQDDYGDGELSQKFFNNTIPEEQQRVAKRTRDAVEKALGSYQDHVRAAEDPTGFGPDILARARSLGSLVLNLQWVRGNATKAEDSFIRINQQAAIISPQELELLKSRKKPNAIASRAIIRRGTGHKYWSSFSPEVQRSIEEIATELHKLIFEPPAHYPTKSIELPAGGPVYSPTALMMVYDFINLSAGVPSPDDDPDGRRTIEYLMRCRRVMHLLLSNHASSLGLHPAVYFYSWTGKQQPILFLVMAEMVVDFERSKRLPEFIHLREGFEAFLMNNRSLLNQVIRKFGAGRSGIINLRKFYNTVLTSLASGKTPEEVVEVLRNSSAYNYLQPAESPYDGAVSSRFSTKVKSGLVMRELLAKALRCPICKGLVPGQAISIDHIDRREDGGSGAVENAQVTHPYCQTGIKESRIASERKQDRKI